MDKEKSRVARESIGCFLMLVLGAFVALGLMVALEGYGSLQPWAPDGWWHLFIAWVVGPAAGIGLIALGLYGFKPPPGPKRPGAPKGSGGSRRR
jgi:hypothetical protein